MLHYWWRCFQYCVSPVYLHNRWCHQSLNICIIEKLEYLWNKKRYHKKTPLYSTLKSLLNKRVFGMTYFSGHVHFNWSGIYCIFLNLILLVGGMDYKSSLALQNQPWEELCLFSCTFVSSLDQQIYCVTLREPRG